MFHSLRSSLRLVINRAQLELGLRVIGIELYSFFQQLLPLERLPLHQKYLSSQRQSSRIIWIFVQRCCRQRIGSHVIALLKEEAAEVSKSARVVRIRVGVAIVKLGGLTNVSLSLRQSGLVQHDFRTIRVGNGQGAQRILGDIESIDVQSLRDLCQLRLRTSARPGESRPSSADSEQQRYKCTPHAFIPRSRLGPGLLLRCAAPATFHSA